MWENALLSVQYINFHANYTKKEYWNSNIDELCFMFPGDDGQSLPMCTDNKVSAKIGTFL